MSNQLLNCVHRVNKILIIEPFYGGSHKQLIDGIVSALNLHDYHLVTMSAKKWPWRARCSGLYLSQQMPSDLNNFRTLFCSSVLNLAELVGLCPSLSRLKKIVYFHENQLIYPVQVIKSRDVQYGYNQITTCLAADEIIFNSEFNMSSFLKNINKLINMMPDYKLKNVPEMIKDKMSILYFPVKFSKINDLKVEYGKRKNGGDILHIVWPHRWEFDKNPESFFNALFRLKEKKIRFRVSIIGETYEEIPEVFSKAKEVLADNIENFGYVSDVNEYYKVLIDADVVVSTANHEFFGVSTMEAVKCDCIPLVPNRLVYPEIYPAECLYNSDDELFRKLKKWCEDPVRFEDFRKDFHMNLDQYSSEYVLPKFLSKLVDE